MKNIADFIKTISSEIIKRSRRNTGFTVISSSSLKAAWKRLGNLKKIEIYANGVVYYLDKRVILM